MKYIQTGFPAVIVTTGFQTLQVTERVLNPQEPWRGNNYSLQMNLGLKFIRRYLYYHMTIQNAGAACTVKESIALASL